MPIESPVAVTVPGDASTAARTGSDGGASSRALRRRQGLILVLLFGGYAALYFCRADLSVASPLLIDELTHHGVLRSTAIKQFGWIVSLGVLAYAIGKLFLTGLGDFWGGRRNFLLGLAGATLFTLLFALGGGIPVFMLAWAGNRLTQSVAWAGLIKVSSKWFDYTSYGTVIGILSISFLVGDAVARQSMGVLLEHGFDWRMLFFFASAVAAVMWLASLLLLRESRLESGYSEAATNPRSLFAQSESPPASVSALLRPLVTSPPFLLVCALSLGCTIVRETFNTWTPEYLRDHLGYPASAAASASALFPAVGALSVLLSGWLSDRLGATGRSLLLLVGLIATTGSLFWMTSLHTSPGSIVPLLAIGAVAFSLLGPYSYLGGAFALDFGGKQASAAASGLIDGVGYLGGVLAGHTVAQLIVDFGWTRVFLALAAVSAVSAIGAACLHFLGRRAAAGGPHID